MKTALLAFMETVYCLDIAQILIFYALNRKEYMSEEDQITDIHKQLCKFPLSTW